MLEQVAFHYLVLPGLQQGFVLAAAWLAGAVIAFFLARAAFELQRVPYFFFGMLILLGAAAFYTVWLTYVPALTGDYVWVIAATDFAVSFLSGYVFMMLSKARSRDAFGTPAYAVLALVPLAGFILLFKRSHERRSFHLLVAPRLASGRTGIVLGLFFAAVSVLTVFLVNTYVARQARASGALITRSYIRHVGLAETLQGMAMQGDLAIEFDETTTLTHLSAAGETLRYHYASRGLSQAQLEEHGVALMQFACADTVLAVILGAGGTLEFVFTLAETGTNRVVRVSEQICGSKTA